MKTAKKTPRMGIAHKVKSWPGSHHDDRSSVIRPKPTRLKTNCLARRRQRGAPASVRGASEVDARDGTSELTAFTLGRLHRPPGAPTVALRARRPGISLANQPQNKDIERDGGVKVEVVGLNENGVAGPAIRAELDAAKIKPTTKKPLADDGVLGLVEVS